MPQAPGYTIRSDPAFPRENSVYADQRAISYATNGAGQIADATTRISNAATDIAVENKQKRDTIESTKLATTAQLAFNERYEKLEAETDNPEGFTEKALALHDEIANEFGQQATNDQARELFTQRMSQTRLSAGTQAIAFGVALGQVNALNNLNDSINQASNIVRRNPEQYTAQLASMQEMFDASRGVLKPEAELRFNEKMQSDLVDAQVTGLAERDASAAEQLLKSGAYDKILSADQTDRLLGMVDAERKKQNAAFEADLEVAVSRGQVSQGQLDAARASKRISDSSWASMTMRREAKVLSDREEGLLTNNVRNALLGGGTIDPNDAKSRKAADRVFNNSVMSKVNDLASAGDAASVDTGRSLVADFVAKTGYVPQAVRSQLYAAARSGDDEQVAAASDLLSRLERVNPQAVGDLQKKDIEVLRVTASLLDSGLDQKEAAARARELSRPADPTTLELRQKRLEDKEDAAGKLMQGANAAELVQQAFSPGRASRVVNALSGGYIGSSKPELPEQSGALAAANRDAQNLFKYWYLKTGDVDLATKQAQRDLKRNWTVSQVSGKPTLMKYAPEVMYSIPGRDPSWIKNQALEDAKKATGDTTLTPDKIVLVSDGRTDREATSGYAPTYGILVQDKDGVLVPLRQQGPNGGMVQGRFAPDAAPEIDKAKGEQALEEELSLVTGQMARMLATKREWVDQPNGDQKLWFTNQEDADNFRALQVRARQLNLQVPQSTFSRTVKKAVYDADEALKNFVDKPPVEKLKSLLESLAKGTDSVKG